MITNVNFNDEAVGVISKLVDETVSLTGSLTDLQAELVSLIACLDSFANGLNESLGSAFAVLVSEGANAKGILGALGEGLAAVANLATFLDSDAFAPLVSTISAALAPAIKNLGVLTI